MAAHKPESQSEERKRQKNKERESVKHMLQPGVGTQRAFRDRMYIREV